MARIDRVLRLRSGYKSKVIIDVREMETGGVFIDVRQSFPFTRDDYVMPEMMHLEARVEVGPITTWRPTSVPIIQVSRMQMDSLRRIISELDEPKANDVIELMIRLHRFVLNDEYLTLTTKSRLLQVISNITHMQENGVANIWF